ncbi:hypothetical protein SAMN06295888_13516 [Desulfonatronum zhilinae]|nr:hypothetical protein SAMN06295888_13516 [Desulfonatronum zhilinae]
MKGVAVRVVNGHQLVAIRNKRRKISQPVKKQARATMIQGRLGGEKRKMRCLLEAKKQTQKDRMRTPTAFKVLFYKENRLQTLP